MKLQLLTILTLATSATATHAQAPRTLAGGRPACGNTMTKGGPRTSTACDQAAAADLAIITTVAKNTRGLVTSLLAVTSPDADATLAVATPRRLATGRPAAGNTVSKPTADMIEATPTAVIARPVAVRK